VKFSDLAKKYDDFLAPNFVVLLGGRDLLKKDVEVVNLTVKLSVSEHDYFSVTLNNPYDVEDNTFLFSRDEYLNMIKVGQKAELKLGYCDKLTQVFVGTVENVSTSFPAAGQSQVVVSGYDRSRQMVKNAKFKRIQKKTYDDVVKMVAMEHTFPEPNREIDTADATDVEYPEKIRNNQNDYNFIKALAAEANCEFFVTRDRFVFRKHKPMPDAALSLVWGETLIEFTSETNLAAQVKEVTVCGWNERDKEPVEGTAKVSDLDLPADMVAIIESTGAARTVSTKAADRKQAKKEAEAMLSEIVGGLLKGSGRSIGLPEIAIDQMLDIGGLSSELNGLYYVTDVAHNIGTNGYTTQFDLRRSA
jgi:phage protein D